MVLYIYCKKCGKVVDEFEKKCGWCGETPAALVSINVKQIN